MNLKQDNAHLPSALRPAHQGLLSRLAPGLAAALAALLLHAGAAHALPGPQMKTDDGVFEQAVDAKPTPKGQLVGPDGKGIRFIYQYLKPKDPKLNYAYTWAVERHLLADIPEIGGLDGLFIMPRPLQYITAQCGTVNAFYNKKMGAVVICYEMIDSLRQMGEVVAKGASDPGALTVEFVRANIRFIVLHESGHALIDMLDLPAVGREEDSVDQMASVLLFSRAETSESSNDIARVLQLASLWFRINGANVPSDARAFADEHSLDAQRYFNLLCMVYGMDPRANGGIVERGMLPRERAARCPDETSKIYRSWARLLVPNFSPRFAPKDNGGNNGGSSGARAQPAPQARNPLEWDGKSNPFGN